MSYEDHAVFAEGREIQGLSLEEVQQVNGGIIPLALAGAVLLTTVEFSFIAGVFDGIAQSAGKKK